MNLSGSPVKGGVQIELDRALHRSNELYRMILFLSRRSSERIDDHPDWRVGIEKLLDGEHFDALVELKGEP